jgi:hypothetical protein
MQEDDSCRRRLLYPFVQEGVANARGSRRERIHRQPALHLFLGRLVPPPGGLNAK